MPSLLPLVAAASEDAWRRHRNLNPLASADATYPLEATVKAEPRIQLLARLLSSVLGLVRLTVGGKSVSVDGFNLRRLDAFVQPSNGMPDEIFSVMSKPCNARCEFCYVRGGAVDGVIRMNSLSPVANAADIATRLRLFESGLRLFTPTFEREEIITHPLFLDTAQRIRAATQRTIFVNTNGFTLTEEMVTQLKRLEPIELSISLNAVDADARSRLMGDSRMTVLRALPLLAGEGMRFAVTVVAWPTLPWDEFERTLLFAASHDPHAVFVILPGHTRQFSADPLFDLATFWGECVRRVVALRTRTRTPILIQPRLFEIAYRRLPATAIRVVGVTPRSPASLAGVEPEDVVKKIGEAPLFTPRQAENALSLLRNARTREISLEIARGNRLVQTVLRPEEAYAAGYRYPPPYTDLLGLHLATSGVCIADLRGLVRIARRRNARRVALATSELVMPALLEAMKRFEAIFSNEEIELLPFVPPNRFYGGTIVLGELMTVSDILCGIEEIVRDGGRPDVVVVPSAAFSVGGWWRDLAGVPFRRLQELSPVPVDMLVAEAFE